MKEPEKKKVLDRHKAFATGLFLLMTLLFILSSIWEKSDPGHGVGYLRAFTEAAMVGALADWFAVTALFHYPLGLRIPHTNLIKNSQQRIGDNLGSFVVENFLSSESIRPYVEKLQVSGFIGKWLIQEKNQQTLLFEASEWLKSGLNQFEDEDAIGFISKNIQSFGETVDTEKLLSGGISYFLDRGEHQKLITFFSEKIKTYILEHEEMIRERVSDKSYPFIPKFVDRKIASEVTKGLAEYFAEVEMISDHPMRQEITRAILGFKEDLLHSEKWKQEINEVKALFFTEKNMTSYATDIWNTLKKSLLSEFEKEDSALKNYLRKHLNQFAEKLDSDAALQNKIDQWVRYNAYRMILRNSGKVAELISQTVKNWEGDELSKKLELEVGKDLQYIRVNGTLVGGLVGLIIYSVAHLFI